MKKKLVVRHLLDYSLVMDTTFPATPEEYEDMQATLKAIAFQDKCAAAAAKWNSRIPVSPYTQEEVKAAHEASMIDYLSRSSISAMD